MGGIVPLDSVQKRINVIPFVGPAFFVIRKSQIPAVANFFSIFVWTIVILYPILLAISYNISSGVVSLAKNKIPEMWGSYALGFKRSLCLD